jgi:hypothetical protein
MVGKCDPPKDKQWKKGQSGNPKGKPKGTIGWRKRFENLLNESMQVPDVTAPRRKDANGNALPAPTKPGKVADVLVAALVNKGFKGDTRAAEMVIAYTGGGKLTGSGGSAEGDEDNVPITQININIIDPNGLMKDDE